MALDSPAFEKMLSYCDRCLNAFDYFCVSISILFVVLIMSIAVYNNLLRLFFDTSLSFYVDVIQECIAPIAFLALSYVQRFNAQLKVDLLLDRAKGQVQWIYHSIITLIASVSVIILMIGSYQHFYRDYHLGGGTESINMATWPGKLLIPAMMFVLFLRLLLQLAGYLRLILNPSLTPIAVPHEEQLID